MRPRHKTRRQGSCTEGVVYARKRAWVTCEFCGKRGYLVRAEAKRVAKVMAMTDRDEKLSQLAVYRCGDLFHVGHVSRRAA